MSTETAALTELKTLLEALDFGLSADPAIYIYPDDFLTLPSVSLPFVTIGVYESAERSRDYQTLRNVETTYPIYIRIYTIKGEVVTSTAAHANFENDLKGVGQKLDLMLFQNKKLNGTVIRVGNGAEFSLWAYKYMGFNTDMYSGLEYIFNVTQRII